MTPFRSRGRLLLMVLLLCLPAACATSDATPDGFVRVEGEGFAMAVPEGWEVTAEEPGRTAITGTDSYQEVFQTAIVQVDEEFVGDFRTATRAVIEPFRIFGADDLQEGTERTIEVPGAEQAVLVELSTASEIHDSRSRQVLVFAVPDAEGPLVLLQLSAPDPVFDPAVFETIAESLELRF